MKNKFLASTAVVALSAFGTAAVAEITISGTARIGLKTTEGSALISGDTVASMTAADSTFVRVVAQATAYHVVKAGDPTGTMVSVLSQLQAADDTAPTTAEYSALLALRELVSAASTSGATDAIRSDAAIDLTSIDAVIARTAATMTTAVAAGNDQTSGTNRVRISFSASGETDSGLSYGASIRADNAAGGSSGTGGSQYLSGSFGKISMGDLDGADEQIVGNLAGVGLSGAGFNEEFGYQSTDHNLGYSISMGGVSFAATTDLVRGADSTKTGSNSAMGIKWTGDMGGASVNLALGQSKVGVKTENSMSLGFTTGGLTLKAVSHTNDNGPAGTTTAAVTAAASVASGSAHVGAVTASADNDTDTTGVSVTYAMDAMSVTAFTRTEATTGVADKDYSGFGFSYDLGGATIKAGYVDANNINIVDFGVKFSF
jgi:outer membrane protein OmpU